MKYRFTLILLFSILTIGAKSQQTLSISGKVKDETNLPMPGATVFLTGTKSITSCSTEGNFQFNHLSPGTYEVVVKMIGYLPFIRSVKISEESLSLDIQLKPNDQQLKEVIIHSIKDKDRAKYQQIFKKYFLGQSHNATYCDIVNPEVIYFKFDKETKILTASADELLVIQNKALGYKLEYLLNDFTFDSQTNIVSYQGSPSFMEMTGTKKENETWTKNRKTAYMGSVTHFLRAVYDHKVKEEGFMVFKVLNRPMQGLVNDHKIKKPVIIEDQPILMDSLLTVADQHTVSLSYQDCLYVIYKNEEEQEEFVNQGYHINIGAGHFYTGERSFVYLLPKSINIDNKGLPDPANGFFFEGYWAWEKIADLVPLEWSLN